MFKDRSPGARHETDLNEVKLVREVESSDPIQDAEHKIKRAFHLA